MYNIITIGSLHSQNRDEHGQDRLKTFITGICFGPNLQLYNR